MNREIKFRGKSKETGQWLYGDLVQWRSKKVAAILPQEGDEWKNPYDFEVDPETVGRFTGLKDKNGKDIYEWDIFHCNGVNYVLKYKTLGRAYTVHNAKNDEDERFLHHCNSAIEIIGNIYENPELLA